MVLGLRVPAHVGDFMESVAFISFISFSERLGEEESEGLEEVAYREADGVVTLKTAAHSYTLDVHRVDPADIAAMRKLLRRMNFDGRVQMSGV